MKRSRNPEKTRQEIIAATHRVLQDGGYFTRFSLDTVAAEAGVSKGGLLHHFGSKKDLLRAAAQNSITQFEAQLAAEMQQQENLGKAGAFTRAYIESVLGQEHDQYARISPVLLSYLRSTSGETRFSFWQKYTNQDELPIPLATIIRLALDGLIYTEMIDNTFIDEPTRQEIRLQLLKLIETQ